MLLKNRVSFISLVVVLSILVLLAGCTSKQESSDTTSDVSVSDAGQSVEETKGEESESNFNPEGFLL